VILHYLSYWKLEICLKLYNVICRHSEGPCLTVVRDTMCKTHDSVVIKCFVYKKETSLVTIRAFSNNLRPFPLLIC